MKEIWKDIKGYEGSYKVSNLGRIKSIERKIKAFKGIKTVPGKILKVYQNDKGYCIFSLQMINGKRKTQSIHRVVAEAFLINTNKYYEVNHKDGNKLNNRINNLEWCSHKDNCIHSWKVLGRVHYKKLATYNKL